MARTGGLPLDVWLVEQSNLRGFYGAFGRNPPTTELDPALTLEAIVVGLLLPHGPADGRLLKLVVRILQSGRVDPMRLAFLARRERADAVLAWLLDKVPPAERTDPVTAIALQVSHPRGPRAPDLRYDANRLIRRPFRSSEAAWTRRPGSS